MSFWQILKEDFTEPKRQDPAYNGICDLFFCYPGVWALINYRFARFFYERNFKRLARFISGVSRIFTAVDINPGAKIGRNVFFDHATGLVIGETAEIGNNCLIYQGVTLGAKHFRYDPEGRPMNIPRHPILEDNVTVYSNTSILGRVRIGHDTVIGGNVWLTHDVPPRSRILQTRAVEQPLFTDGAGI